VFVSPIANPYSLNIWSAPACGTPETALQLEVDLHDNEHVDRFWISSDSRHVAYSSSQSPLFHSSPLHRSRPRVVSELTPYSLAFVRGGSEVVFGAYSESRHSLFIDRFPSGGGGSQCLTCDYDFDLINFLPVTGDSVVVAARPRDLVKRPEVRSLDLSTKNAVAMLVGRDLQESDHPFVVSSDHQYLMFGQFDDAGSRLALAPLAGPIDSTLSILLPYGTGLGTFEFIAPGEGGAVLHVRNEFPLGRCHRWDFESPSHLTPLSAEDLPIADLERPCQQIPNRDAILFPMGDGPGECCGFFLSHIHGPTDSNPWRLLDTGEAETPHYADPNYQLTTDGERLIFRSAIYAPDTSKAHLWSLPLPLFWDSFESGTVGHWDSAVGLQL
jgi:hypothetical protein